MPAWTTLKSGTHFYSFTFILIYLNSLQVHLASSTSTSSTLSTSTSSTPLLSHLFLFCPSHLEHTYLSIPRFDFAIFTMDGNPRDLPAMLTGCTFGIPTMDHKSPVLEQFGKAVRLRNSLDQIKSNDWESTGRTRLRTGVKSSLISRVHTVRSSEISKVSMTISRKNAILSCSTRPIVHIPILQVTTRTSLEYYPGLEAHGRWLSPEAYMGVWEDE